MKKCIALVLFFLCVLSIVGCDSNTTNTIPYTTPDTPPYTTVTNPEKTVEDTNVHGIAVSEVFDINVSYANWAKYNQLFAGAMNSEKMSINNVQHLPIYKFDTLDELEQFKQDVDEILTIDQRYDEVPSFNETTADYDESFFEENTLMLVYVGSGSSTYRYGLKGVYAYETTLCIHVEPTNNPIIIADEMAGWFITVALPDSVAANYSEFDAEFN